MKEKIIRKWYKLLRFPQKYDQLFEELLEKTDLSFITPQFKDYDIEKYTQSQTMLAYLYYCEKLKSQYDEKGISQEILFETLSDMVVWANVYYSIHKGFGLGSPYWLKRHLSFELFKLGRLQFCKRACEFDVQEKNIKQGDPVLDVHIQEGDKLEIQECISSFELAEKFFSLYFGDYDYKCFTCHSWLLDPSLEEFLKPSSNILAFKNLFELVLVHPSDDVIKYVFRKDATRENLKDFQAKTSLAVKLKESILQNNTIFNEGFGIRNKKLKNP